MSSLNRTGSANRCLALKRLFKLININVSSSRHDDRISGRQAFRNVSNLQSSALGFFFFTKEKVEFFLKQIAALL